MAIERYECSQCGSSEFEELKKDKVQCIYCDSQYQVVPPEKEQGGGVVIREGANVTFGKNSKVVIKGGLEIEEGANVKMLGELLILKKGSPEKIEEARQLLKKLGKEKK